MTNSRYGSRDWIESQYASSKDDPWGLDWRPTQKYRYERMFAELLKHHCRKPEGVAILDIGCATGAFTAMLSSLCQDERGKDSLIGIDISPSAIARASKRFNQIRFECMGIDECAHKYKNHADIVTCLEVLYYLPKEQRADTIRQLKSMIKPGGVILVSSMVAKPPYFSFSELESLLSSEFNILGTGLLYLKPLVMCEKILMKLGRSGASKNSMANTATVAKANHFFERFLPRAAQSHAYIVARKEVDQ